MPPFIEAECPQCGRTYRFDLAELKNHPVVVFREEDQPPRAVRRYRVRCPRGHEFVVRVPEPPPS